MLENFYLASDPNDLVGKLKTTMENVLHSGLQVLHKSEKQNSEEYLTRADVAERFHCSLSTVHRLSKSGVLKPLKFGRRTLFRASEVNSAVIPQNLGGTNYAY